MKGSWSECELGSCIKSRDRTCQDAKGCHSPLIDYTDCNKDEVCIQSDWSSWSKCFSGMSQRERISENKCYSNSIKNKIECDQPEVHNVTCSDICGAPLWSEWEETNSCKMIRHCNISPSHKVCPTCPGQSEKVVPCRLANYCNQVVQLSNSRFRHFSVRPASRWFDRTELEQAYDLRGSDSEWEICCNRKEGTHIAQLINYKNNVKLIRGTNDEITVSDCSTGSDKCTGNDKWKLHENVNQPSQQDTIRFEFLAKSDYFISSSFSGATYDS